MNTYFCTSVLLFFEVVKSRRAEEQKSRRAEGHDYEKK